MPTNQSSRTAGAATPQPPTSDVAAPPAQEPPPAEAPAPADPPVPPLAPPPRGRKRDGTELPLRPQVRTRRAGARSPLPAAPDPLVQVYSVGGGFKADEVQELDECLAALHADPRVAETVRSIRERATQYLTLVRTPATGWGLEAKIGRAHV